MIDRSGFAPHSEVIELASNDGYLVPALDPNPLAGLQAALRRL
jgi:hypothetical protein